MLQLGTACDVAPLWIKKWRWGGDTAERNIWLKGSVTICLINLTCHWRLVSCHSFSTVTRTWKIESNFYMIYLFICLFHKDSPTLKMNYVWRESGSQRFSLILDKRSHDLVWFDQSYPSFSSLWISYNWYFSCDINVQRQQDNNVTYLISAALLSLWLSARGGALRRLTKRLLTNTSTLSHWSNSHLEQLISHRRTIWRAAGDQTIET